MNFEGKELKELFELADQAGNRRYHRLTQQDFGDYRKYDYWRYMNGDSECGTTQESQAWVRQHSGRYCPICEKEFIGYRYKTIDHKLPRAQYPWLSLNFKNFWIICRVCNEEKSDKHWYEYEHYMFVHRFDRYPAIKAARPIELLRALKD